MRNFSFFVSQHHTVKKLPDGIRSLKMFRSKKLNSISFWIHHNLEGFSFNTLECVVHAQKGHSKSNFSCSFGADFFYSAPFSKSKSLIRLFKLVFGLCKVAINLLPAFCIFTLQEPAAVNRKSFSLPLHPMKGNQLYVIVRQRFYIYAWLRSPPLFLCLTMPMSRTQPTGLYLYPDRP